GKDNIAKNKDAVVKLKEIISYYNRAITFNKKNEAPAINNDFNYIDPVTNIEYNNFAEYLFKTGAFGVRLAGVKSENGDIISNVSYKTKFNEGYGVPLVVTISKNFKEISKEELKTDSEKV